MLMIVVVDTIAKYMTPPIIHSLHLLISLLAVISREWQLVEEMPTLLRILFTLPVMVMMVNSLWFPRDQSTQWIDPRFL